MFTMFTFAANALNISRIAPVLGHSTYTLVHFACGCIGLHDPHGELTVSVLIGCAHAHARTLDHNYQRGMRDKFAE